MERKQRERIDIYRMNFIKIASLVNEVHTVIFAIFITKVYIICGYNETETIVNCNYSNFSCAGCTNVQNSWMVRRDEQRAEIITREKKNAN